MESSPESAESNSAEGIISSLPTPPSSTSRRKSPEELNLEHISYTLSTLLIERQWTNPLLAQYYSPRMKAYWDEIPTASNREEYFGGMEKAVAASPDYRMEVLNTCAAIDPGGRTATSWVTTVVKDLPFPNQGGMNRETVVRSSWKKTVNGWVIIKNTHTPGAGPAFA